MTALTFETGTHDADAIFAGPWGDCGLRPLGGNWVHLGAMDQAKLIISNGFLQVDEQDVLMAPGVALRVSAGIDFECGMREWNVQNASLAFGETIDQYTSTYAYNYIRATKTTGYHSMQVVAEMQHGTNAGFQIVCYVPKASMSPMGNATFDQSNTKASSIGLKLRAFVDRKGVYNSSTVLPGGLGWLYSPVVVSTQQL